MIFENAKTQWPIFLARAIEKAAENPSYRDIRPEIIESLWMYVVNRIETGGFLRAVLSNDLKEAAGRGDHINVRMLNEIVTYIYMELPSRCWGSPEKVAQWLGGEQ